MKVYGVHILTAFLWDFRWCCTFTSLSLGITEGVCLSVRVRHPSVETGHQESDALTTECSNDRCESWPSVEAALFSLVGLPSSAARPCCSQTDWEPRGQWCCGWSHRGGAAGDHSGGQTPKLFHSTAVRGSGRGHRCPCWLLCKLRHTWEKHNYNYMLDFFPSLDWINLWIHCFYWLFDYIKLIQTVLTWK